MAIAYHLDQLFLVRLFRLPDRKLRFERLECIDVALSVPDPRELGVSLRDLVVRVRKAARNRQERRDSLLVGCLEERGSGTGQGRWAGVAPQLQLGSTQRTGRAEAVSKGTAITSGLRLVHPARPPRTRPTDMIAAINPPDRRERFSEAVWPRLAA